MDKLDHIERAYSAKEVRAYLGVGDSTLRKWCLALEKSGYHFSRNEQNRRFYVEKDLVVLSNFKILVQDNNMPLENAANVIALKFSDGAFPQRTDSVPAKVENNEITPKDELFEALLERYEILLEKYEKQEQFNKELLQRLDKQQEYIDRRFEKQEQLLLDTHRTVQENKQRQLEIASSEESLFEKQEKFNKELLDEFGKQKEYLEERDRQLIQTIRSMQEEKQKKLEEAKAEEENEGQKKGFFARLFGGK